MAIKMSGGFGPITGAMKIQKPIPATDPHWNNVVLLLDGETFTDLSNTGHSVGVTNTQLNTSVKYSGNSSYYFGGPSSPGRLAFTDNMTDFAFGTGDFTVESWVHPTWLPGPGQTVDQDFTVFGDVVDTPDMFFFLNFEDMAPRLWDDSFTHSSNTPVSLNTWTHVAWTRSGGELRIFTNGVQTYYLASHTVSFTDTSAKYVGGTPDYNRHFEGYIDNLRITKGVARYTENFTPPTFYPLTA